MSSSRATGKIALVYAGYPPATLDTRHYLCNFEPGLCGRHRILADGNFPGYGYLVQILCHG